MRDGLFEHVQLAGRLLLRTAEEVATWPQRRRAARAPGPFEGDLALRRALERHRRAPVREARALAAEPPVSLPPRGALYVSRGERSHEPIRRGLQAPRPREGRRRGPRDGESARALLALSRALETGNRRQSHQHPRGRQAAGAHAIRICGPKRIVVGSGSADVVRGDPGQRSPIWSPFRSTSISSPASRRRPDTPSGATGCRRLPRATPSRPRCRRSATWPRSSTPAARPAPPRPRR